MPTNNELEDRITKLEALLKGQSPDVAMESASVAPPTAAQMAANPTFELEEVHIPIYAEEVGQDVAPVHEAPGPLDVAPQADVPAGGQDVAPVQVGTRRI